MVAQRSKRPNVDFGRMRAKNTIWSHNGQKGVKNPGGKLSEPLASRSEVSPGQNFENLTNDRTSK